MRLARSGPLAIGISDLRLNQARHFGQSCQYKLKGAICPASLVFAEQTSSTRTRPQSKFDTMLTTRLATQSGRTFRADAFHHNSRLSAFSRSAHNHPQKSANSSNDAKKHTNPGEMPAFSFKDLGATRPVKVVVYLMVGIIGTAETFTYGKWAYHAWWKPSDEVESAD